MPANNIHILSEDEVKRIKERFNFEVKDEVVLVKVIGYARVTAHSIHENIYLRYKDERNKLKKITIHKDTIKIWIDNFMKTYSLIEVQNAINMLLITYQIPSVEDIANKLKNPDSIKIRKV